MTAVIEVTNLTRHYRGVTAVDDISFTIEQNVITGLLGRNGAGKTTLLQLITAQDLASSGDIRVFGQSPVENAAVLQNLCFIKESQRYPDDFRLEHVLRSAPWFFPNWDAALAERLAAAFRIPRRRRIKKLSRGQVSAIGVVVGIAARAPLTLFDEPYLGLDAVARQLFYDELLADYAENPRTIVISTHLIDEIADLLERVLVIDEGRILIDDEADALRESATTVTGTRAAVDAFVANREVLHRDAIGGLATATVGTLSASDRAEATAGGLELGPVSLQQLVIRRTSQNSSQEMEPIA